MSVVPADALIERAANPIVAFGRQLGRDELYAAALGAVLTALVYAAIGWWHGGEAPVAVMAAVLPWVSPLCEKPGLVSHYVAEAFAARRREGGGLGGHLRRSLLDGRALQTVRADLLYHDPAYAALMAAGIWVLQPEGAAAVAFLSVLAFSCAVAVAAGAEVATVELGFRRLVARLSRSGFAVESYHETRYLIVADGPEAAPEAVLDRIAREFGLGERMVLHYDDLYYRDHRLPGFNGRAPTVRLRTVRSADGACVRRTVQAVYTRAAEIGRDDPSLFRCFAVRKDKLSMPVPGDGVPAASLGAVGARGEPTAVRFSRVVARDPAGLFVSADVLERPGGRRVFWIEAKVRGDLGLLKRANEFIAMRFPVRGTTKGKFSIVEGMEEFRRAEAA